MAKSSGTKPPGTSSAALGYEAQLWAAADKMRGHMDASEYKHVALGLIFLKYITTMVTGTSGSHQRGRPESLLNMDAPLPPEPMIQEFTDTVAPMLKRISQNIHESRTVAALRDALLPKLLSGGLRVAKAEEIGRRAAQ